MLIYQIDGNRYQRKNFDEKGSLINYQIIEVGKVNLINGILEATMTIKSYDVTDKLQNASQTMFRCNPEAKEVIMGIFPFAGGKSNKSLKVEMPDGEELYPMSWRLKNELEDFNFRLKLEGGAGGFFGGESRIAITDRKVKPQGDALYRVSGKMTLKAYVAGLRISTVVYEYLEDIDPEKGIVRQRFTEDLGDYFTIELMTNE